MKKVHIGKEIEKRLLKMGMSISEFSVRIGCSRRSVYRMFEKNSIDIDILRRCSEVLETNFIKDYYLEEGCFKDRKTFVAIPIDEKLIDEGITITVIIKNELTGIK